MVISLARRRSTFLCRRTLSLICAPMVCTGLNEDIGSWNTMAICSPRTER